MAKRLEASRKARRLVTSFEQSAGSDYWMQDQGTGSAVDQARQNCEDDRNVLLKYIARLERRVSQGVRGHDV